MAPRSGVPGSAPERRFFLAHPTEEAPPELAPGDLDHALRVLRLQPGDRLVGLDGQGGAWPLEVGAVGRGKLALEKLGPPRREPRPGEPGSLLPWIEVAVPWPKGGRAEEMIDRLTQLGAAAIAPLDCERAGPQAGDLPRARRERLERVLREACKQSGRTWMPLLRDEDPTRQLRLGRSLEAVLLDPGSTVGLAEWVRGRIEGHAASWTCERPLLLLVGPEGGFTDAERERYLERGASPVRLGPHVLRVETAAEAAMAVVAAAFVSAVRS